MRIAAINRESTLTAVIAILLLVLSSYTVHPVRSGPGKDMSSASDPSSVMHGPRDDHTGPEDSRAGSPMMSITDSTVDYAILAPQDFTAGLQPLADWHSKYGIRTKVYSMDDVQGQTGVDTQEKIHKFLQNLNATSPYLRYVLLVGDHELIPSRYMYVGAHVWDLDYSYISDHYYACLGSSWDTNHNGTYGEFGEEDWTPDVYVGRIPIDQASEVSGMVDRIINYRTYPPSNDWIKRMIVWTSVMVAPNSGSYQSHKDNAYKIHSYMDRSLPSAMDKVYLADYTELEGGNYSFGNDNFTRSNARSQLNDGAALLTFAGQAYYDESVPPQDNSLAHYSGDGSNPNSWSISYNYEDADQAANGGRLPFAFVASCDTLNFSESDDSNLERWNTIATGGVIGQIGNSGRSWRGEETHASRGNWWMIDEFWEQFFRNDGKAADAFYKMKETYARDILPPFLDPTPAPIAYGMKCNIYGYNFLGDPALDIWHSRPRTFKPVSVTLWEGTNWLNLTVRDVYSTPVPNARVTVQLGNTYSTAVSDGSGNVSVPYQMSLGDSPRVSFHANGLIPMSVDADVQDEPADLTMIGGVSLSEDEPCVGTSISLSVNVKNVGAKQAAGVKVGMYEGTFHEDNLIGELALVGTIAAGDVKQASVEWDVSLSVNRIIAVVDPEDDVLESDEDNNRAQREITVVGADLTLEAITLSSSAGYNVSTAGSTEISIFAHNDGGMGAEDVSFNVYWEEVGAGNRLGQEFTLPNMAPGAQTNVKIEITPRAGYSRYVVAVDPDNEIPEMNETNNYVTFNIFGNQPPLLDTTEWENVTLKDEEIVYNIDIEGSISDPDTKLEDLIVSVTHGEKAGVSVLFTPPYDIEVSFAEDFEGEVKLEVRVSDRYSPVTGSINITRLAVNLPPVIKPIPDETVMVGEMMTVRVMVSDEDPGNVTFTDDTVLFIIGGTTGLIEYIPSAGHVGTHAVRITATDPKGKNHTIVFNIIVEPRFSAPNIKGKTDHTLELGKMLTFDVEYEVDERRKDGVSFSCSRPGVNVDDNGTVTFLPTKKMMDGKYSQVFDFIITLDDGTEIDTQKYTVSVIDKGGGGENNGDKEGSLGDYLGIILGGTGFVMLAVLVVILLVRRSRKKKMEQRLMAAWSKPREEFREEPRKEDSVGEVGDLPAYGEADDTAEEMPSAGSAQASYEDLYGSLPEKGTEKVGFELDDDLDGGDEYDDEYDDDHHGDHDEDDGWED